MSEVICGACALHRAALIFGCFIIQICAQSWRIVQGNFHYDVNYCHETYCQMEPYAKKFQHLALQ